MAASIIEAIAAEIANSSVVDSPLEVIWHSGEPLLAGFAFFEQAFATFKRAIADKRKVTHFIQTNATLLNRNWCELFSKWGVKVGVSVDGPARIHDAYRRTWGGKETHPQVMRGIAVLKSHGFPLCAICVIHDRTLDHPKELLDFFFENDFVSLGLNVEQIEGANAATSLDSHAANPNESIARFWHELYEHWKPNSSRLMIREFANIESIIRMKAMDSQFGIAPYSTARFGSVTITKNGDVLPHAPEIASMNPTIVNNWTLGNIQQAPLKDMLNSSKYGRLFLEVNGGIESCRSSCGLFDYCGAAYISNKIAEHGTPVATETKACLLNLQLPALEVLRALSQQDQATRGV